MDDIRLHKIGTEKVKVFENCFDKVYDYYKQKAEDSGYWGELKFIKEKGKIIVYTVIELPPLDNDDLIVRVS